MRTATPGRRRHPHEPGDAAGDVAYRLSDAPAASLRRIGHGEPVQRCRRGAEGCGSQRHRRHRGGNGEQAARYERPGRRAGVLHYGGDRIGRGKFGRGTDQPGQRRGLQRAVSPRERRTRSTQGDNGTGRLVQHGGERRSRQQHCPQPGDLPQQKITTQPAGQAGQNQHDTHPGQRPGCGIDSGERGAARVERVNHQRDRPRQLTRHRHAVTELESAYIRQSQRITDSTH
jgi:hypothetical protein